MQALAAGGGARAQLALAAAYFDLRDFEGARAAYQAVLVDDPGNQAARTGYDIAIARAAAARPVARTP